MNKQQLANRIWASANNMRNKIDANEYKDYILGLIFYKFLSDTEVKYFIEDCEWEEDELVELVENYEDMNMKNAMGLLMAHLRNGVYAHIVARQDTKKRQVVTAVELRLQNPMLTSSMCMVVC